MFHQGPPEILQDTDEVVDSEGIDSVMMSSRLHCTPCVVIYRLVKYLRSDEAVEEEEELEFDERQDEL